MTGKRSDWVLQVLLAPQARTSSGIARALEALQKLGIDPSGYGRATLSVRVTAETARTVFGLPPAAASLPRAETARELAVPESLRDLVESITVPPEPIPFA